MTETPSRRSLAKATSSTARISPSNSQPTQPAQPQKLQSMKTQKLMSMKTILDGPNANDDSMVDLDFEKELNTIDHGKMKQSLKKSHVVKPTGEYYGCMEACWSFNAGSHYLVKSSEKSDLTKFGVGIMLYFKFVKHLMFFFVLFALLSVPAYVFYISAYSEYQSGSSDSVSYLDALTATTVGAIGLGSTSCAVTDNSQTTSWSFQCNTGTIASISYIAYGLVDKGSTCSFVEESDLTTTCNTYDFTTGSFESTFTSTCYGQTSCTMSFDSNLYDTTGDCATLPNDMNYYMKVTCDYESISIGGSSVYRSTIAYIVAAFDAAIIIIFIIMIYTLKYAQKHAIGNVQKKAYSAASYTVEFKNLPQTMPAEELAAKLWTFLDNKLGEKSTSSGHRVIDVQIVLPNKLIEYSKMVGEIIHQKNTLIREFMATYLPDYTKKEIDFNGLQDVYKKISEQGHPQIREAEGLFKRIRNLSNKKMKLLVEIQKLKRTKHVRIVSAFVTFSSIPARNKILDSFISSPLDRIGRFCCPGSYDKDISFHGKILRVRTPADPGSILWENLGEPGQKIFARRAFSWLLTLGLWIITAAILIVSTYYKNQFKDQYPSIECTGSYEDPTAAATLTDYQLGDYQVGLLECFCTKDLVDRLDYVFSNGEKLCVTWFADKVLETSITFAIVFIVLIINFLVQFVFQGLSEFEKHSTLNKQLATRVVKTFFAQFLNTGLLILAVNAKIEEISFWQGKFGDLTPLWYANVGSTLVSTMIINIVSVPCVKIAGVLIKKFARCLDRNCRSDERHTKRKNQKSYEELYSGPEFIIDFRYSQILTLVFVCFLYSGGMPILYVTSFFQLLVTYFFDKIFLLKVSKLPKNYDENLEKVVRPIFYVTLFVHLIFTIFMFGNSEIFDQDSSAFSSVTSSLTSITDSISQSNENVVKKFFRRTVSDFNVVLLVLLIILVALFLIKGILLGLLRRTIFAIFTKDQESTQKKGVKVAPGGLNNYTFYYVIKAEDVATLIRLTKVTIKTTENTELIKHLQNKLSLLKQEYQMKQGNAQQANFIGFYTYDVRLQTNYSDQFAIKEMLDDEDLN